MAGSSLATECEDAVGSTPLGSQSAKLPSAASGSAGSTGSTAACESDGAVVYEAEIARQIVTQVAAQLYGSVHEFSVTITEDNQFRIGGWCSSYHVKQVAQHLAMHLVSEGSLINEIEVRKVKKK